jgi:ribosomal protein S18 acetylase RimI-like enzyme
MESRSYSAEADVNLLVDFARAGTAARWPDSTYWHVGDIVWRLFQNTDVDPCQNIRLWIDDAGLAGVGWFEPPSHFEFDVRPNTGPGVTTEIIEWAQARAEDRGSRHIEASRLSTAALGGDEVRVPILERAGFVPIERHGVRMRRGFTSPIPESVVPDGMRLRHATDADVTERAGIHRDAWSVWGPSRVTAEAYRRLRAAPGYRADLDIVVETQNGRFASYCICWVDVANGVGEFEPLGTRPEFTRRGLARAVIFEGLRRMRHLRMHTALVQTANINVGALALYTSCGFEIVGQEHVY